VPEAVPAVETQLIPPLSEVTVPDPDPDVLTASGYRAVTLVMSLAPSLLVSSSPPPDTLAVFVTGVVSLLETSRLMVMPS